MDLVSVIIPLYNAEKFISSAIESVINQTHSRLELIIVNDGSTDNSLDIAKEYASKDKRITVINQKNQGCSNAKNAGLRASKGNFIQYLDADDLLSSEKIEKQLAALTNKPFALAICKTVIFNKEIDIEFNNQIDTDFLYTTTNTLDFLLNLYGINGKMGMIQPNAFLMPKPLCQKTGFWDSSLSPSPDEDGEYFCRAILAADEIIYTEGVNYYRKNPNVESLSKKRSLSFAEGAIKSVVLKFSHIFARNDSNAVKQLFAEHLSSCAYLYGIEYPILIDKVEKLIKELGMNKIPPTGGKYFKFFSKLTSFKFAMKVKKMYLEGF